MAYAYCEEGEYSILREHRNYLLPKQNHKDNFNSQWVNCERTSIGKQQGLNISPYSYVLRIFWGSRYDTDLITLVIILPI